MKLDKYMEWTDPACADGTAGTAAQRCCWCSVVSVGASLVVEEEEEEVSNSDMLDGSWTKTFVSNFSLIVLVVVLCIYCLSLSIKTCVS